jgi:hypothetical protein
MLQMPLLGVPTISVFYTNKIQGGQDRAYQFQGILANKEAHNYLFWFRTLL